MLLSQKIEMLQLQLFKKIATMTMSRENKRVS